MIINYELFPPHWIRFPFHGRPIQPIAGPIAGIQRRVVRQAFHRNHFKQLDLKSGTDDDHWVASVTRWLRRIHRIRNNPDDFPTAPQDVLDKMGRCVTYGYKLENPDDRSWFACYNQACLFCYAKKASSRYNLFRTAIKRAPKGAKLWIVRIMLVGNRKALTRKLQRLRIAAAVSVSVPGVEDETGKWFHRAVALTDDRARVYKSGFHIEPLRGPKHLVDRLSDWLRYPTRWLGRDGCKGLLGALELIESNKDRMYWGCFGAARKDYTPGKGMLDFAGNEPKPSSD